METFTCSIMLVVLVLKISKAIKLSFFFFNLVVMKMFAVKLNIFTAKKHPLGYIFQRNPQSLLAKATNLLKVANMI